jgi:hypothetical protein
MTRIKGIELRLSLCRGGRWVASHPPPAVQTVLVRAFRCASVWTRQSTLPAALRAARRVNPFPRRGLCDNRQKAGAVAGRAYLFNYFRLYWLHYECGLGGELPEQIRYKFPKLRNQLRGVTLLLKVKMNLALICSRSRICVHYGK